MPDRDRYPLSMRLLHWTRAALVLGLIALGWLMTSLADAVTAKFTWMYPNHKQFGVLAFIVALIAIAVRRRVRHPAHPAALAPWEGALASVVQSAMLTLAVVVPLLGYAMSSSFTESDGVPFFIGHLPELLPKNDRAFALFQWTHKTLAYALLGLIALHIAGVLKHRFFDARPGADVLQRMM